MSKRALVAQAEIWRCYILRRPVLGYTVLGVEIVARQGIRCGKAFDRVGCRQPYAADNRMPLWSVNAPSRGEAECIVSVIV